MHKFHIYMCLHWMMSQFMLPTYQHQQWLHMISPKWGVSWHQERYFVCGGYQRNQHQTFPSWWSAPHAVVYEVSLYLLIRCYTDNACRLYYLTYFRASLLSFLLLRTSLVKLQQTFQPKFINCYVIQLDSVRNSTYFIKLVAKKQFYIQTINYMCP